MNALKYQLVNNERNQTLREQLNRLQSAKKITFQQVADALGISRAYISEFANGKRAINDELAQKLADFLAPFTAVQAQQQTHAPRVPFVLTDDVREMITLIDDCREKNLFGVIAGAAGLGKTTTIRKYAEGYEDVYVYTPDPNITLKEFLLDLADLFGVTITGRRISEMSKQLTKFLQANPRFLIIDEFGWIMRNGSMRIIESLRGIREACNRNLGIVLSGHADDFADFIRNSKAQIYSRLGPVYELQGPSKEECRKLVESLWMTDEAKEEMAHLLWKFAKRDGMRSILEELYEKSVRLAGEQAITLEILKEAGKRTIYGYRSSFKHA